MRKKDKITIASIGILIIMITGLWGFDFSSQYLTVTDVKTHPIDQPVEVMGNVKPGTLVMEPTSFILTDDVSDIDVYYNGNLVPQLCEGAKVSVRGVLISPDRIDANFLVLGCPSKYEVEHQIKEL